MWEDEETDGGGESQEEPLFQPLYDAARWFYRRPSDNSPQRHMERWRAQFPAEEGPVDESARGIGQFASAVASVGASHSRVSSPGLERRKVTFRIPGPSPPVVLRPVPRPPPPPPPMPSTHAPLDRTGAPKSVAALRKWFDGRCDATVTSTQMSPRCSRSPPFAPYAAGRAKEPRRSWGFHSPPSVSSAGNVYKRKITDKSDQGESSQDQTVASSDQNEIENWIQIIRDDSRVLSPIKHHTSQRRDESDQGRTANRTAERMMTEDNIDQSVVKNRTANRTAERMMTENNTDQSVIKNSTANRTAERMMTEDDTDQSVVKNSTANRTVGTMMTEDDIDQSVIKNEIGRGVDRDDSRGGSPAKSQNDETVIDDEGCRICSKIEGCQCQQMELDKIERRRLNEESSARNTTNLSPIRSDQTSDMASGCCKGAATTDPLCEVDDGICDKPDDKVTVEEPGCASPVRGESTEGQMPVRSEDDQPSFLPDIDDLDCVKCGNDDPPAAKNGAPVRASSEEEISEEGPQGAKSANREGAMVVSSTPDEHRRSFSVEKETSSSSSESSAEEEQETERGSKRLHAVLSRQQEEVSKKKGTRADTAQSEETKIPEVRLVVDRLTLVVENLCCCTDGIQIRGPLSAVPRSGTESLPTVRKASRCGQLNCKRPSRGQLNSKRPPVRREGQRRGKASRQCLLDGDSSRETIGGQPRGTTSCESLPAESDSKGSVNESLRRGVSGGRKRKSDLKETGKVKKTKPGGRNRSAED